MNGLRVMAVTLVMFLVLGVASVYANPDGNLGLPILGTTGAPALAGGAPSLFSGVISVLYADGTPVVLSTNQVTLNLCNTSCETLTASLTQTSPGTYTYSFTPPTALTGTVTIYIKAYGLADDNGRIFPSVDTSIGTYAYSPSTTSSSQQLGTSLPPAGTPPAPLTRQAVNTSQNPTHPNNPTTTSPVEELLLTLGALTVAGSLLVIPKRH
jgi:hypothetical protein